MSKFIGIISLEWIGKFWAVQSLAPFHYRAGSTYVGHTRSPLERQLTPQKTGVVNDIHLSAA